MNALKTTLGLPDDVKMNPKMDDAAVTYIFGTTAGNVAFVGDGIYHDGFYGIGQRNQIDVTVLNMGHNPSGSNDKLTPWDAFRVAKALKLKVVIPDHYENWGCTYLDPDSLEEIVKRNDPNMKTVIPSRADSSSTRTIRTSDGTNTPIGRNASGGKRPATHWRTNSRNRRRRGTGARQAVMASGPVRPESPVGMLSGRAEKASPPPQPRLANALTARTAQPQVLRAFSQAFASRR